MSTKSQQAQQAQPAQQVEQKTVETDAGRNRATGRYRGRAAMAVVTVAIGTALTALVIGVTGSADTKAPPSPGFIPPYGNEVPPKGLDQRLYELADEYAEKHSEVPPKGLDQRLYNLAEEFAARQRSGHPSVRGD